MTRGFDGGLARTRAGQDFRSRSQTRMSVLHGSGQGLEILGLLDRQAELIQLVAESEVGAGEDRRLEGAEA